MTRREQSEPTQRRWPWNWRPICHCGSTLAVDREQRVYDAGFVQVRFRCGAGHTRSVVAPKVEPDRHTLDRIIADER